MSSISVEIIVIISLVLFNGLLAMSEMAIVSSRKAQLKNLVKQKYRGAKTALKLAESDGEFLASIQVGITLIGVLAGAFSGATIADKLSLFIQNSFPDLAGRADAIGLGVVVVVVTFVSLILGELVPKKIALNNPEKIATKVSKFISFMGRVLSPIVYVLSGTTNLVLRMMRISPANDKVVTEEEVKILITEGTKVGIFDKHEETMIKRVLKLDDRTISELLTPRVRVVGVNTNDTIEEVLALIVEKPHSYYPIFDNDIDQPIGLISNKIILRKLVKKEPIDLKSCMLEPIFLPGIITADEALNKFRSKGVHVAVVIDEHGGFEGMLTINDIIESIIGEFPDHAHSPKPALLAKKDDTFFVDGDMSFKELSDELALDPIQGDDNFQTVGGFLMSELGQIPQVGDIVTQGPYRFEVVRMDRHRVDKVLIVKNKSGLS